MTKYALAMSQLFDDSEVQLNTETKDGKKILKSGLSFLAAQRMINKFLTCDRLVTKEVICRRFTERELAKALAVDSGDIEIFTRPSSRVFYRKTAGRIAAPLIRLYCSTKWVEN